MDWLKLEQEGKIILPEIFKSFYKSYSSTLPENLIGTDLWNNKTDLNSYAVELLYENKVDNFLANKDFVFMVHQGYIFWYFKADGNPDPNVFSYYDGKLKPEDLGPLSKFVALYR
jgi:hypothetical protein